MPTQNAPPDAAVARFRDDLRALIDPVPADARIGVAVSGGPDSLALLLLANAGFHGRIAAATVNHGLRPEAADEAAMVARLCVELEIPHQILVPEHPLDSGGNVQERARILRYQLLGVWADQNALPTVVTAHHLDDVAEGFLMRAMHGAGVGGLARMKASAPLPYVAGTGVKLLRPLLGWRRHELAKIVADTAIVPADDPSNRNERYDRARARALLATEPLLNPVALAHAATNLADAEAALEWMSDAAWRNRAETVPDSEVRVDSGDLPFEIRRRLAARAIRSLAPDWNGEGLDRLIGQLDRRKTATLAGVRGTGGPMWRFGIAPPHRRHR